MANTTPTIVPKVAVAPVAVAKELAVISAAPSSVAFLNSSFHTRRAITAQAAKLAPTESNIQLNPTLMGSAAALALTVDQ